MSDEHEVFSALVQELFDLAVAGGTAKRGSGFISSGFIVRHGGYAIRVEHNAGSSKDVSLHAVYDVVTSAYQASKRARPSGAGRPLVAPRPLAIELGVEDEGHVAAKAKGLNVEWQSGDEAFDRTVYVDTPTTDPAVLAAVIGPEVRYAVRVLLGLGFRTVSIDDGTGAVNAYLTEFTSLNPPRPNRGADSLSAFAQILAHLPEVTSSGPTKRKTPLWGATLFLAIAGGGGWGANYFYLEGILAVTKAVFDVKKRAASLAWWEIAMAVAVAVVAGIVGSFLHGRLVAAFARGTSSAHQQVQYARAAAFFGTSAMAFAGAVIAIVLSH